MLALAFMRDICAYATNRGSYMSAHVILKLLNKLMKRDRMQGMLSIYLFFAGILINSIIHEHEC